MNKAYLVLGENRLLPTTFVAKICEGRFKCPSSRKEIRLKIIDHQKWAEFVAKDSYKNRKRTISPRYYPVYTFYDPPLKHRDSFGKEKLKKFNLFYIW